MGNKQETVTVFRRHKIPVNWPMKFLNILMVLWKVGHVGSGLKLTKKVHLISQWYNDSNSERFQENLQAVCTNCQNSYVSKYFLFSNENIDLQSECHYGAKIEIIINDEHSRISMDKIFEFASQSQFIGEIFIFLNLDIFFDESLAGLIRDSWLDYSRSYFLSRYETVEKENSVTQCSEEYIGSHDSIVFRSPLPKLLINRCQYQLGSWGIENRIMWEFNYFGIQVRNPCKSIRSWHLHNSKIKNDWMPKVNNDQYSSVAFPQFKDEDLDDLKNS